MFSSRHPDTLKGLADELGPLARAGTVAEALDFGDVVMVSFRCAPKARVTSGGGFRPESCRLIW